MKHWMKRAATPGLKSTIARSHDIQEIIQTQLKSLMWAQNVSTRHPNSELLYNGTSRIPSIHVSSTVDRNKQLHKDNVQR
ncbi:unnamed protein product [Gongylonema pulchrum]|uniref:Ovule protein n=1 Tax=Gongylonema pulchrum TaxID=637853 RepID=A0A183E7I1_9BILA|nr:unnamed protein product [Gongylonema pulchrum]